MFNFAMKANVETFEKYNVNAFSYTLRDMISDWCHNHMSNFPNCTFSEFTRAFWMSLKDLEWRANIHGAKEHEARGDWEGGSLLWVDSKVGSWSTSTNHI